MTAARTLILGLPGVLAMVPETAAKALDRDDVIRLASAAPAVRAAEVRVEEARGRLLGATVFAPNPSIEGLVGPRLQGSGTELEIGLALPIELGGRRAKRRAVATAEVEREVHAAADLRRLAVGSSLAAYYRVLHAGRRLALAEERSRLADELLRTAQARERAGDVARFDVALAEGEVGRAQSLVAQEEGELVRARVRLGQALGLASVQGLEVVGDLADRSLFERRSESAERADVRRAAAEVRVAADTAALAQSARWPDSALRVEYAHEVDVDLVRAGVSLTVPLFDRGQAQTAEARAWYERASLELEAQRQSVALELQGARSAHDAAAKAVTLLEARALPSTIRSQAMAHDGYVAGKIALGELLIIRRDALETRREHVDRLLDAALAGVELWVAEGRE